jgi:hypothetical protein
VDIDADNEIYVTGNWAQVTSAFSPNPGAAKQGNLSIRCDNAYLPASVAAGCVSGYPTGVMSVGTANAEFPANINVHPTRPAPPGARRQRQVRHVRQGMDL